MEAQCETEQQHHCFGSRFIFIWLACTWPAGRSFPSAADSHVTPAPCKGSFQPGKQQHTPGLRRITFSAITRDNIFVFPIHRIYPVFKNLSKGADGGCTSMREMSCPGSTCWIQALPRSRQRARRREERMTVREEMAEFSTAAESPGYSPFPCSLMVGLGSPPPTLSTVGEQTAEGWRILNLEAHKVWLQGALTEARVTTDWRNWFQRSGPNHVQEPFK